ncbi:MAG: cupin domain-containing protein [Thermomicrobiales bacterium]
MTKPHLGLFDLSEETGRLAPGSGESGRRAEILIMNDRLRVVLIRMKTGAVMKEHSAPGPATVQALSGAFILSIAGIEHEMSAGGLIAFDGGVPHNVRAIGDGALLLTIAWAPDWHGDDGDSDDMA